MIQTFCDYENACSIIDKCKCDPDCNECKRGIESTDDFEGMILTAALHGDMGAIINAGGARPHRLLTWSEFSRNDDIDLYAGKFCILPNGSRYFTAFCDNKIVGGGETRGSAKLACERHARKMLGWEV